MYIYILCIYIFIYIYMYIYILYAINITNIVLYKAILNVIKGLLVYNPDYSFCCPPGWY